MNKYLLTGLLIIGVLIAVFYNWDFISQIIPTTPEVEKYANPTGILNTSNIHLWGKD